MTASAGAARVYQLDAIRGVLAIGVMGYHVLHWPAVLGTWGVYAFFVLSGYALDHVYRGRLALRSFVVARVARLAPLWIPVVLVSALVLGVTDPVRLALNLTGAFGIVQPGATSIVTGGWSIGIEVVCYVLFPLLIRLGVRELAIVTVATIALRFAWVGGLMPADLEASWVRYTEIPSFLCFFVGGMLLSRTITFPAWSGGRAQIATALGEASYGVYLLHPLVAAAVGPLALFVTPVLALAVRYGYEIPVGRRLRRSVRLPQLDLGRVVLRAVAAVPADGAGALAREALNLDCRRTVQHDAERETS